MSLEQILRQVNLGQAQCGVMVYALSLQTNGAMQAGILFERLIDEQFVQNDVNNVLKKVPFSVYGAIFTKELMSDLSIARAAYDLAVQTYFRFSEGFLIEKAKKWEEAYLTDAAFRGLA
jgi:methenyltetrahydromethanopterin cyclohydrolase